MSGFKLFLSLNFCYVLVQVSLSSVLCDALYASELCNGMSRGVEIFFCHR